MKGEQTMVENYKVLCEGKITGSVGRYPARTALINLMKQNKEKGIENKIKIRLQKSNSNDEVLAYYSESAIGTATFADDVYGRALVAIDSEDSIIEVHTLQRSASLLFNLNVPVAEDDSRLIDYGLKVGMSEQDANKRIRLMLETYGLSVSQCEAVCKTWQSYPDECVQYIPTLDKVTFVESRDRELYECLGYCCNGDLIENMRFIGIQSSGKNTLIDSLCALLYKPYYTISCSAELTKEHIEGADTLSYDVIQDDPEDLVYGIINNIETESSSMITADTKAMMMVEAQQIGKKQLMQTIEFCEEAIVKAMRYGCFVLFDEINLALSAVMGRYHSALDKRREIVLPRVGLIKAAKGFAALATMNPIGYIGTREMNQALESRFTLSFELQAPKEIKSILKKNCPDSKDEDINIVNSFYQTIYSLVEAQQVSDAFLSIRNYENALLNIGFGTLKKSLLRHVCLVSANDMDSVATVKDALYAIMG